jgi:colanic acid/amylovoran biosynthesis glycosyltransferase
MERPAVSVIVPFGGGASEVEEMLHSLRSLRLGPGDEALVADNTPGGLVAAERGIGVVRATDERSSYHARNAAAEAARNPWLLFLDADCRPPADLLGRYFSEPVEKRCGALVGEVDGMRSQHSLVARYARSRGHLRQAIHLQFPFRPFGITANLMVRRAAWAGLGGFQEGVRSGADAEFSWRLQDAGWKLVYRPAATVEHRHRETVPQLARRAARLAAGRAWLNRRYPGSHPRPRLLRRLGRCASGVLVWTSVGRWERAAFKGLDAVVVACEGAAYFLGNGVKRDGTDADRQKAGDGLEIVVFSDTFPAISETFVANEVSALRDAGHRVRVEAGARSARPHWAAARPLPVTYLEDDGIARRLADNAWLLVRHPVDCVRDVLDRRRWAREEPVWPLRAIAPSTRRLAKGGEAHLHAHFAASAALNSLRLARIAKVPYSVATHGYDIFQRPTNLVEKHARAAFAVSACKYSADYLRGLVGPPHADRIHEVVMGVDGERFRRRSPYPGGRAVLAVARMVEKKGLRYLIEAVARARVDRVTIVGDGPLRKDLEELSARLGLEDVVEMPGWQDPDAVRDALDRADLLAMPCVVAGDGDRDTMPVVVKEALAMEVPVVASDAVGLPEAVRPQFGRLVAPGDSEGLAAAIDEVLDLPASEREAMGKAGRAFALEHFDLHDQATKLAGLVRSVER